MKALLKIDRAIEAIQTWFCTLMFVLILIFGAMQVFGRFLFHSAPPWTEEAMRFCGIYLTFIGSALTVRVDGHVSVDILISFLKNNKVRAGLFCRCKINQRLVPDYVLSWSNRTGAEKR